MRERKGTIRRNLSAKEDATTFFYEESKRRLQQDRHWLLF
ncbi:unnamed protein product [Schistosoma curassoni]|uniref:Uncharacterized protein n=1 Tax=Schistosoma curassoni TaxID=6186 RepID=A0A183L0Z1_9TREM|nr:unnamed protein product [Schistosoma curassoni]